MTEKEELNKECELSRDRLLRLQELDLPYDWMLELQQYAVLFGKSIDRKLNLK